jgi:hypothetical protein
MSNSSHTIERKPVTVGSLIGTDEDDREGFNAALDALTVGALVRRMCEQADGGAGISHKELGRRLNRVNNVSKQAIAQAERGMPLYAPLHSGDDHASANFVLLVAIARVCGLELIPVQKPASSDEPEK